MPEPRRVAVLGTGIMGAPIACNLAAAGHAVTAWNRTPARSAPLRAQGVQVAPDPAAAVAGAEVVILMLSTGPDCDALLFDGPAPLADALPPEAVVCVMSSIPVSSARSQAAALAARGVAYVDAPVSGGEAGAQAATLAIMAGGEAAVVARIRPVLSALGHLTHVGPVGSGQLVKLANQMIVGVSIAAVAEALALAEAGGADPAAAREAMLGGFADSTVLRRHGARMIGGDFTPGARSALQLKDLRTALAQAGALGLDLPVTGLVAEGYERLCRSGGADLDHSALYDLVRLRGPVQAGPEIAR